jgi:hypothetical protein
MNLIESLKIGLLGLVQESPEMVAEQAAPVICY